MIYLGLPKVELKKTKNHAKENIKKMSQLAKSNDIIPVFFTEVTITSKNTFKEKIMSIIGRYLRKKSYQDQINEHVIEMNNWLKEYAKTENIPILDVQVVLSDEYGRRKREYSKDDGSHISQAGYLIITKYFNDNKNMLRNQIKGKQL